MFDVLQHVNLHLNTSNKSIRTHFIMVSFDNLLIAVECGVFVCVWHVLPAGTGQIVRQMNDK